MEANRLGEPGEILESYLEVDYTQEGRRTVEEPCQRLIDFKNTVRFLTDLIKSVIDLCRFTSSGNLRTL